MSIGRTVEILIPDDPIGSKGVKSVELSAAVLQWWNSVKRPRRGTDRRTEDGLKGALRWYRKEVNRRKTDEREKSAPLPRDSNKGV